MIKTLDFLQSRRHDLEIRASFLTQLQAYEARLKKKYKDDKFTESWHQLQDT